MATQNLIWTALPAGVGNGTLRLSAMVSPRLLASAAEGDRLDLWPLWVDWTDNVAQAGFAVSVDGGPAIPARLDRTALDRDLWRRIFPPDTFVRSHRMDNYAGRQVISYPAGRVYDSIRRVYQEAGTRIPAGAGARQPLTWTTDYVDLGTDGQPTAQILAVAGQGRFVYAAHQGRNPTDQAPSPNRPFARLVKIDLETRQVVAEVRIGDGPRAIALLPDPTNPDRARIYVLNSGPGIAVNGVLTGGFSLMMLTDDGTTLSQPVEIRLGIGVVDLAVSATRNRVYVAAGGQRRLLVLDADTGATITEVPADQPDEANLAVAAVAVDDAGEAVIIQIGNGGLTAGGSPFPAKLVKLVPQGAAGYARASTTTVLAMRSSLPHVAVDPDNGTTYLTNDLGSSPPQQFVTVVQTTTGAVAQRVPIVGTRPLNVATSPRFRFCYVLRDGRITIMGPGNRVLDDIGHDLRLLEGGIAVHPETEQVIAGGSQDGRVLIATPSSTEVPVDLDDLLQEWNVAWTADAEQAARDGLGDDNLAGPALTSRVLLFHRRPPEDPVALPTPAQARPLVDFHEALSALGDHPAIMRRLGIVVDLELPTSAVPAGEHNIQVLVTLPDTPGPQPVHQPVSTAATVGPGRFAARSRSGEIVDGLLALDGDRYQLQQLDLDGATLKLVNQATALGRVAPGDPKRATLPALRTGGIALGRNGQGGALTEQFSRSIEHDNAVAEQGDTLLFAEDLLAGFRIDVWDGTSRSWHSLCRRTSCYTFGTGALARTEQVADEGAVDIGVTEAAAPQPGAPPDLYATETVAGWTGWSLVARRPGSGVTADGQVSDDPNDPLTSIKLRVEVAATPGSLPTLRFGESYRVRARTMDLAGNGPTLQDAPDSGLPLAPTRFPYLRFEPVPTPAVVVRSPITEQTTPGEALERLVLRTANATEAADSAPSAATAERHIAAPRSSVQFAETHGAIDRNGRLNPDSYLTLVQRDAGQFAVHAATDMPVDASAQLALPYLPDPLSRGATLRDLPGTPAGAIGTVRGGALGFSTPADGIAGSGSATRIGWDGPWPQLQPFRIVVRDGDAPPAWDATTRVLTVALPKGAVVDVPLSSFMAEDDLRLMAVWHWLREYADAETRRIWQRVDLGDPRALDRLAQRLASSAHFAVHGGHAMLTPARRLVLVHAVQQPLGRPVWNALQVQRARREPVAQLLGGLQVHARSTAGIELRASWDDAIDDVRDGPPAIRPNQAVLLDLPLPVPPVQPDLNRPLVDIEVGGRRVARYHTIDDRVEFVPGRRPTHSFGDTRHRRVRYRATATSRFREYFASDVPGGFARDSEELTVSVPSSAAPAAPRVRYVVPTFGWERSAESNLIASRRRGHGLRVYLDRPWYSSGAGELLGVVLLRRTPTDPERPTLKRFISQAGADPLFSSRGRVALNRSNFGSQAITWGTRLTLPGLAESVDVAGHRVGYDADRDLWYCDISYDPDVGAHTEAYSAFVRFALVRFQPDSLPDLELSQPVTTEFIQLWPDRTAVATYDQLDPGRIRLTVAGQTYNASRDVGGQIRQDGTFVQVSVEERIPGVADELGWRPAQATVAGAVAESVDATDTLLWQGEIVLPADRAPGRFRLVIKEFEPWLDDAVLGSDSAQLVPRARRLVYAETVEL